MRASWLKRAFWWGLVVGMAAGCVGCSQSVAPLPANPPSPTAQKAPGSAKPQGGAAIASPRANPAPPGVQTGNYAGGRSTK